MDVFSKAGFSFGLLAFIFARITLTRTGRLEEKLKAFSILEQAFKSEYKIISLKSRLSEKYCQAHNGIPI